MPSEIRIERRFRGPTESGNGGWTAGRLAACHLAGAADGPVQITLRRPPLLDTPLTVDTDGETRLLAPDGGVVAEAVAGTLSTSVDPVDVEAARHAERDYAGFRHHPFPECFTCGIARAEGDGMRVFPGPLGPGRTACTWTPHPAMAGPDGRLDPAYVWAALDCPGGWSGDLEGRPMVLGRMTAQVDARPVAGETHVAVGRLLDVDGRKTYTASTVYDSGGRVVGTAVHVWIAIDPTTFS
jgi:hypothetical protein